MTNHDLVLFVSHTIPAMLTRAGKLAVRRFLEVFTVNTRNANTRAATSFLHVGLSGIDSTFNSVTSELNGINVNIVWRMPRARAELTELPERAVLQRF